jgi:hypothetical protein
MVMNLLDLKRRCLKPQGASCALFDIRRARVAQDEYRIPPIWKSKLVDVSFLETYRD